MAKRKTFNVESLRKHVNDVLKNPYYSKECRSGFINTLEYVLFESDNYKGFRYLSESETPKLELPGIRPHASSGNMLDNTDNTRRHYF